MTGLNDTAPHVCIHADYGNPFKVHTGREISIDNVLKNITDPYLLFQIERVSSFHGYLSTGAFIGIQMLNIAKRVLGADPGEQLFVTCETYNCLPDPFQILAGCTIGNKKLKIKDHGKMAVVGIVNDTPVFALPGKPTGAFTAIEMVVRRYFTEIPRAMRMFVINEDVVLPENGFEYILFVKIAHNTASAMSRDMKSFDGEYNTAIISASPRSAVVDGYLVTDSHIGKGEQVNVFLFN